MHNEEVSNSFIKGFISQATAFNPEPGHSDSLALREFMCISVLENCLTPWQRTVLKFEEYCFPHLLKI